MVLVRSETIIIMDPNPCNSQVLSLLESGLVASLMALPMHEIDPIDKRIPMRIFLEIFMLILKRMISGTDKRAKSDMTWHMMKALFKMCSLRQSGGLLSRPYSMRSYCEPAGLHWKTLMNSARRV